MTASENEIPELSEQDKIDLRILNSEPEPQPEEQESKRSLLELWAEVLQSVEASRDSKVPMAVAHSIVTSWPKLNYRDIPEYHVLYHEYLIQARDILTELIHEHPQALEYHGLEDGKENANFYLHLLVQWNILFEDIAEEWSPTDDNADVVVAALVEARNTVLGRLGMAGHLDNIGFQVEGSISDHIEAAKAER